MADPRRPSLGTKTRRPDQTLDAGPAFDASSLVVPPEAERDGIGAPRRRTSKSLLPLFLAGGAAVALAGLGAVLLLSSEGGEGPGAPPAPLAEAPPGPKTAPMEPIPDPTAAPAAVPAKPSTEEAPPARPEPPRAAAAPAPAEPIRRPHVRELPAAKGSAAEARPGRELDETRVDRALERLAEQAPKGGKELLAEGDAPGARSAFDEECRRGVAASCLELGRLLVEGRGGDKDTSSARESFAKACTARSAMGCLKAAELSSAADAPPLLAAACDLADAAGCRKMAEQLAAQGEGTRAMAYHARACALGDRWSCKAETETSTR